MKSKKSQIKTYNPKNGFIKHYWTIQECQHILVHLNGKKCTDDLTNIFPHKGFVQQFIYIS